MKITRKDFERWIDYQEIELVAYNIEKSCKIKDNMYKIVKAVDYIVTKDGNVIGELKDTKLIHLNKDGNEINRYEYTNFKHLDGEFEVFVNPETYVKTINIIEDKI